MLKAERPFMLIIIGRKKKLFKMICCKIPLFHNFSKSVSEGIVLPFWILLHRNCLRQLALNNLQAYQFFPPEARSSPQRTSVNIQKGLQRKGLLTWCFLCKLSIDPVLSLSLKLANIWLLPHYNWFHTSHQRFCHNRWW